MAYQPKSYRKFVATTATAAMVASAVAPVVSAAAGFTDVASQYKDAVDFLVSAGVKGKSETKFGVYDEITRLDAAVILAKVLKLDVDNAKDAGFTDVPKDRAKYVNALVDAGVLNGKAAGKFGAYDKLTRAEMAKIIANAYKLKGDDVTLPFTDVNDTWAPYVKALYKNGITKGKSETKFGANDNITRGDFAVFVYRAANVDVAPQVVSVSAINGKQIEIKFNKPVDKSALLDTASNFTGYTLKANKLELAAVDGANANAISLTPMASLSSDGKTLTIYAASGEAFNGKYTVTVKKNSIALKDDATKFIADSTSTVTVNDTTRPSVKEVKYVTNSKVRVYFTEPLEVAAPGTVTVDTNDTTVPTLTSNPVVDGQDYLEFNISTLPANKDVELTIKDLVDFSGNVQAVNPAKVTVKKDTTDNVNPTVVSVTPTSDTTFDVKFSEEVDATTVQPADFEVNDVAVSSVTQDETDPTLFHVTHGSPISGLAKVEVLNTIADKSGNPLTPYTNNAVNFGVDAVAPKVVSTKVERINGTEYLVVTYDEYVRLNAASTDKEVTNISYVKDLVTNTLADVDLDGGSGNYALYKPDANGKSKSIQIKLSAITGTVTDADFTAKLAPGIVEDLYGNDSAAYDVTFKRTSDYTAGATQDVTAVFAYGDTLPSPLSGTVTNPNEIYVQFTKKLDASALVTSNYTVEGATVTKAEIVSNTGNLNENIVKLTLAPDSVKTTTLRYVTIKNVGTPNGNALTEKSLAKTIRENVRPTLVKAELVAGTTDKIKLTFSENLANASVTEGTPVADFDVIIGGTTVAGVTEALDASDAKVVVLDLGKKLNATELSSTITVKATTNFDVADSTGLTAQFTSVNVK
ncbi:S-layer homology domain-containing protein [Saccharococcus caldoxylosilyticus]|uniref:S-layer homology domain-containing protein n=1 Tax=Saccharococcus caldoxylosilyticus TaxID=81408 RepID=UPI001FCBC590|nr:S-layer homology domain-containing protein [Parageobacillus caldoxylosilyticus]BDG37556.1 S-layer protein [Parageobacillus caldoxylosilyticus]BDG41347.1 S-layer protein [Parageobacillus caldoxylosilyticus]